MSDSIRQVQLIQLELMKKLHDVCIKNNIKYTLLGGSLLGAVRHKGFIPWDDDLDIGLLRADYEKLLSILREQPIDGCFLQEYSTEEHYIFPFAKLRLNNTKYLEKFSMKVDMHQGIFIDIFPLDKIDFPGSKGSTFRRNISRELTFAIWSKEKCRMERKGIKKIEYLVSGIISIIPKKYLCEWQNKLVVRENRNWNYVASMFSSNYSTEKVYFEKDDFDSLILLQYEDTEFFGPSNWDKVLTRMFKDYMKLPPVNKRNSGHDVVQIEIDDQAEIV